jgi:hypothetical protein
LDDRRANRIRDHAREGVAPSRQLTSPERLDSLSRIPVPTITRIPGRPGQTCDGWSRREFLRVGGAGLLGLFLIGAFGSGWVANILISQRPRR